MASARWGQHALAWAPAHSIFYLPSPILPLGSESPLPSPAPDESAPPARSGLSPGTARKSLRSENHAPAPTTATAADASARCGLLPARRLVWPDQRKPAAWL